MEKSITINTRHDGREKSGKKSTIQVHRRIASCNREEHTGGMRYMRKSVMYTIGGGITRRNLTTNSAEILTEVAVKLWRLNKTKLQRIGMIKPTTSTAVDYLIYHAAKDGLSQRLL